MRGDLLGEQTKRCGKCGKTKPVDGFNKNRSRTDGLQGQCRECMREYQRAWHQANAEAIAERKRAWHEANREAIAERKRAHYAANAEKIAEYGRAYREVNAEAIAERQREFREANAERIAEYMRASLAGSRGLYRKRYRKYHGTEPEVVDKFTLADVVERYGAKCWHCGDGEFEEVDHYPVSVKDGGPHSLENVRPSCSVCNQQTWREETKEVAA